MTRKLQTLAIAAAMLAGLPAAANAAVTYVFTADSSSVLDERTYTGGFTLTTNDYITANNTFAVADLTSCTVTLSDGVAGACGDQNVYVGPSNDIVGFAFTSADGGLYAINYFFDAGTFAANGAYATNDVIRDHRGTLTVSGFAEPATGGVPEPATWALMIAGFGLAGASLRRRGAVAAS